MNGPSREEIDAKLAANKSWLEGRVGIVDMDMKTLLMRMDQRDREAAERNKAWEKQRLEDLQRREKDEARWEKQRLEDLQRREKDESRWERQRLEDMQQREKDEVRWEKQRLEDTQRWNAGQQAIMAEFKHMRRTVIVTGITATLAIVFGVAAFNATLLSGMTAAFEAGRSVAAARP